MNPIKKNTLCGIEISDMNNLGYGVGRIDGVVCFVADGVIGDSGTVRIIKSASGYLVGKWEERKHSSPMRSASPCSAFPRCGGCSFCHVDYSLERKIKTDYVIHQMKKEHLDVRVIAPEESTVTSAYRNKALIPIAEDKNGFCYSGFFATNTHRAVKNDGCLLQPEIFSAITLDFTDFLNRRNIKAYDEKTDRGVVRHLYLRSSGDHKSIMVCPVLRTLEGFDTVAFTEFAKKYTPYVKSVFVNIQPKTTNVVLGDKCIHLWGDTTIKDSLCGLDFDISPLSFYQINHHCASRIYQKAAELSGLDGTQTVFDLYCGTGTIGLSMAKKAKALYGIEVVADAVENARNNAKNNNIKNAEFICADADDGIAALLKRGISPDLVVIDPPRKGTTPEFIKTVSKTSCNKVIYISCNPATLARDLAIFKENGFFCDTVYLYDMFPRTGHVESVVCLTRSDKAT
ncbi:MAG: 23S rRNA (uracil(1939)-C(5))-methyltransferase RlmD [Ruminococcaceae bacterium]|nr:23S rRNA (uracil(1939)-C(5))-methyltransferase RlmD [Oscillospiraceae bacterium]